MKFGHIKDSLSSLSELNFASVDEVNELLEEFAEAQCWLAKEKYYLTAVAEWLKAESLWKARVEILKPPDYQAAQLGWQALRGIYPNLDGVTEFSQLSEANIVRYAVFAAAVRGWSESEGAPA